MDKFITRQEVLKTLKIHYHTLYAMVRRNEIETIKVGYRNLYNLDKYLREKGVSNVIKKNVCYCRVSSNKQKPDLTRQQKLLSGKFPNHLIISDVGSGLNFKRKGLNKLMDMAIKGEINDVVVTYKDRLCRIGYDLIENIIQKYSNGKIVILNKNEEETKAEEISKDIISIMNIYVAKINGLRKYTKKLKKTINDNGK